MKQALNRYLALAILPVVTAWAGALVLNVGNPESNPEAKSMNAALIATVTACHDPAKSTVTANFVRLEGGELRRTQLKVEALRTPGAFAILGTVPPDSVIDLSVTNPEYRNYQPRILVRRDSHGVQWASVQRFFRDPPSDSAVKNILGSLD